MKRKSRKEQFFFVFSPDSATPPTALHVTHGRAYVAALRLATRYPGQKFFVVGSMSGPITASGIETRRAETAQTGSVRSMRARPDAQPLPEPPSHEH